MHKFIIPTMNAAAHWPLLASALLTVAAPADVLILDSESTDGTSKLAHSAGFELHSLNRCEFNHGATRQLGVELAPNADLLIFMTQDAVLASQVRCHLCFMHSLTQTWARLTAANFPGRWRAALKVMPGFSTTLRIRP